MIRIASGSFVFDEFALDFGRTIKVDSLSPRGIMIRTTTLIFWFALILVARTPAAAQTILPPTNLAVEVYYYPGEAPAYLVVSPANATPGRAFYSRFKRLKNWKDAAGVLPVTAVDIKLMLNEDSGGVRAIVSAFRGKVHEQQQDVGAYAIREGEKIRVEELSRFGIEPFELALVRVTATSDPPSFSSASSSIELVSIRALVTTFPTYQMVLRNVAPKNIRAIRIEAGPRDRPGLLTLREGKDGEPLITAGSSAEITMRIVTRAVPAPGGFTPVSPDNQVIRILAIIYDDQSFDGDAETVAQYRAVKLAERIQLTRVVAAFEEALTSSAKSEELIRALVNRIERLSTDVSPDDVQRIIQEFPNMTAKRDELRNTMAFELGYFRKDVVDDINRFKSGAVMESSLRPWLESSKERYLRWLARLS